MTNPALTDRLQCPNVELDATKEVTLRRHLQLQWDIYASDGGSATAKDVYEELLEIMRYAVEFWGITSIPTLLCKELSADAPAVHCSTVSQYSQDDKACWTRLPSKDTTALSFHQEVLTACDKSDKRCTIFDVMFQFIFGRSSKKLRENTQFELINLQEKLGVTFVIVTHD